jgi:hypothetical protein
MESPYNEQVVFRDYPLTLWLFGIPFLLVGTVFAGIPVERDLGIALLLGGVVFIALPSILTVTVEPARGMLNLRYRSLIRASTKMYPLNEISVVNVAEDSEGERMYRLELFLRSGEVVPLRWGYLVGKRRHERQAHRLRSVLGL